MGHGFFAVNIFAGGARVAEDFAMLMVGYRDDDSVHIFAIEDLFVIARCRNIVFDGFLCRRMPRVVEIAYRNALNSRHAQ